jgi:hypothetical protein
MNVNVKILKILEFNNKLERSHTMIKSDSFQ